MFEQEQAHVLVVDNEAAIRLTLDVLLQRAGYTVTTAADGEEPLVWLLGRSFDLLLLELSLPGISGLNVARYAQEHHPAMVIVFLTSVCDWAGISIKEQAGSFEYIRKTASPQEVLTHVAAVLCPVA